MNAVIQLASPKSGSFNHAIAATVSESLSAAGHKVILHDLYREHFDPVLPAEDVDAPEEKLPDIIRKHTQEIRDADILVFVHPNWWGGAPAILRGWLDRVFRQGFAYKFSADGVVPMFTEKSVQVFSTSNTPREVELNVYKDPIEHFWKTIVFGLCGSKSYERRNFEQIITSTPEQRTGWLKEVAETITRRFG
ncbi:MAG: NAD(P)H-dependent oxidoreductase [Planctomycetaceae bacterium]|jgi:putative NADPH-quinone reductase|nr:NAD(P)H-dependent oxidoreductase [Planctomycetaceae bacterium]